MKHLMIFSIGPVQDFIATARRSRDLWYGSWMLSELARVAAKEIASRPDNELIFPAETDIVSIPNKIVAIITVNDPKSLAKEVEDIVRDYLKKELAEKTLTSIPLTEKNKELANRQIDDLLELYWVSVPYNNRTYDVVREEAEALFVARKVTRDFNQMLGANVPKSSLDGSRESVIDENDYPNKDDSVARKEGKVKELYDNYHARQGERLSGVDLLKRLGAREDEPDFKSTSHMAAIPFMEKLGEGRTNDLIEKIRELFDITERKVSEKDYGSLLYDSRLTDWIPAGDKQNELRIKFNELMDEIAGKNSRPDAYFALIRADGDNMGKVIDGQTEEKQHQELSETLSKFAGAVEDIVNNQHEGLLIYSGGDDVLAYLPVDQALSCAAALEKKFKNAFREDPSNEESPIKFLAEDGITSPTLSVGIVVAHHLDPLSDVLKLARDAEHTAKEDVAGKNGLAVTLSKRSGIDRTIVGKFSDLHGRLTELKNLFDSKLISGGTAYELQELHRTLSGTTILPEGIIKEALRILERKKESDSDNLSNDVKDKFKVWINSISLNDLANEMIIAKSLAGGAKPSTGQEEEAQK